MARFGTKTTRAFTCYEVGVGESYIFNVLFGVIFKILDVEVFLISGLSCENCYSSLCA